MQVWSWPGFWSYFVNPYLLGGVAVTVGLTAATLVLGMAFAFVLVLMRLSGNAALTALARFHVWLFRGTPLLVQLIIIYTGLPQLGLMRLNVIESALLGLVLNEAAYLSEILRGGIQGVPQGQRDAALALGLTRAKAFMLVTVPQALRLVVPALGNSVNGLLKTTSITSVISMEELLRRGQVLMQQRFEVLEVFVCVAVFYLAMTTIWEFVQQRIEAHFGKAYAADAEVKALARDDH